MLVVGVGGWATLTDIAGAVIAPGQLVVESDVKKVQHPTGGVVGQLLVREGDRVKAGDVLIRLDETQVRANLDIVLKALDELDARRARDEAERDDADRASPSRPSSWRARTHDPAVAHLSTARPGCLPPGAPAAPDRRRSSPSGSISCARRSAA